MPNYKNPLAAKKDKPKVKTYFGSGNNIAVGFLDRLLFACICLCCIFD